MVLLHVFFKYFYISPIKKWYIHEAFCVLPDLVFTVDRDEQAGC